MTHHIHLAREAVNSISPNIWKKPYQTAMLPDLAIDHAYVRSLTQMIACDIHPLNNLGILEYLQKKMGCK